MPFKDTAKRLTSTPKKQGMRLGIDLGGTKTEAVILDGNGDIHDRWRVPSPQGNYQDTLAMINGLFAEAKHKHEKIISIGIGIPGSISDETQCVKNANSTWLIGQPLQKDIERLIGSPVSITNDANCFALSEATDGAGKNANIVWGVILGTGVGSGIVVNGSLLTGANAISGEWGHNPLTQKDKTGTHIPACYCGKTGCIETFLSGPAMVADHQRNGGTEDTPQKILLAAQTEIPSAQQIRAQATLRRYVTRLAQATAYVINILDPDIIVIGGGLSNIGFLYEELPKNWNKYVFSDTVKTKLSPPMFGDSSGVRGAAWLGAATP